MVREIGDIVNVSVSIQDAIQSREGFGVPIITHGQTSAVSTSDRVKTFTKPADMLDDGFISSDIAYKMAVDMFAQSISPSSFKVATYKKYVDEIWTVTYDAPATAGEFTITIDAEESVSIAWNATASQIQAALELLTAVDRCVVSSVSTTGFIVNFKREDHTTFVVDESSLTGVTTATEIETQAYVAGESWSDIITAIETQDTAWYEIEIDSNLDLDILDVASEIETRKKQFGILTIDDVINSDSGHIAASLTALGYKNSFLYYSDVDENYIQSAIAGRCLPANPGSINWNIKALSSVSSVSLTPTQATNAETNNVNYLATLGGLISSQGGQKSVGGTVYRDTIRGMHYLISKIEENIYNLFISNDKIPYTNQGISAIEAELRRTLDSVGVANNIITAESIVVTVPDRADTSAIDRAARFLDGITFSADLAGAINKVTITGTLSQ